MIRQLMALSGPEGRRQLRRLMVLVVAGAVLQGVASVLAVPLIAELLRGDTAAARPWFVALAVTAVLYGVAYWGGSTAGRRTATVLFEELLLGLGERVRRLPLGAFLRDRSGETADLAARRIAYAASVPYGVLRPVVTAFVTPATVLLALLLLEPRLALVLLLAVPVLVAVQRAGDREMRRSDEAHATAVAEAGARLVEFARAQPALRAAGDGEIGRRLLDRALHEQHRANRSVLLGGAGATTRLGAAVQLTVCAVLALGTWLAVTGRSDPPTLVALLVLVVRFVEPVVNAGAMSGGIGMARNTLERLAELDAEPVLPEPDAGPPAGADGPPAVTFRDVSFGYGGPPVLRGVSFEAPAGAMTAVVGPSGSGKTTVMRLAARYADPDAGTVLLGGVPLPELGSERVQRSVAQVFQDVYLFDDTVEANVRTGRPEASPEEVRSAMARAGVDEILHRLPDGAASRVGEGGALLSGGERQRVAIARALLKDSPVVLLDEATSALDARTERAVGRALEELRQGRTLIVVAHRLNTVVGADRIVVLDEDGQVAATGTHDSLLAQEGPYSRFWHSRTRAAGWRLRAGTGD